MAWAEGPLRACRGIAGLVALGLVGILLLEGCAAAPRKTYGQGSYSSYSSEEAAGSITTHRPPPRRSQAAPPPPPLLAGPAPPLLGAAPSAAPARPAHRVSRPAPAPPPPPVAEVQPFCQEVKRRISVADCEDFTRLAQDVVTGTASYSGLDRMWRQHPQTVQLAVSYASPPAKPSPAAAMLDLTADKSGTYAVRVGRLMTAELVGPDFDITPPGPQTAEVLPDGGFTWTWQVTPRHDGPSKRQLTFYTVVGAKGVDGRFTPLKSSNVKKTIEVEVKAWDQVNDLLAQALGGIKGLTGVLTSLTVLVGAVFGLMRAFRGRGEAPKA